MTDDIQFPLDAIQKGESWRMFRIMAEFVEGFEDLHDIYPAVSIFGSSRSQPGDKAYEKAFEIGKGLAEKGNRKSVV